VTRAIDWFIRLFGSLATAMRYDDYCETTPVSIHWHELSIGSSTKFVYIDVSPATNISVGRPQDIENLGHGWDRSQLSFLRYCMGRSWEFVSRHLLEQFNDRACGGWLFSFVGLGDLTTGPAARWE
jgi:hypothetical protein